MSLNKEKNENEESKSQKEWVQKSKEEKWRENHKKKYNIINVTSKKEIKLGRNKNGGCHNDVKKEAKFEEQA